MPTVPVEFQLISQAPTVFHVTRPGTGERFEIRLLLNVFDATDDGAVGDNGMPQFNMQVNIAAFTKPLPSP